MSELIDELLADARDRMSKSVEATQGEFNSVRTGRASPSLLDRIQVDYYGSATPLKQLATIHPPQAQPLTLQPFDKSSIKNIEKSIRESDLGLNPSNDGNLIRLSIPRSPRSAGARWSRSCATSPRRGASRSATSAATSCTTCASCARAATRGR